MTTSASYFELNEGSLRVPFWAVFVCEDDFNLFRAFFLDFSLLSFKFITLLFNAKGKIKVITCQFFVFKLVNQVTLNYM